MNKLVPFVVAGAFTCLAAPTFAAPTVTVNSGILSGVQDTSNMWQASTNFGFKFTANQPFYLNQIALSAATTLQGSGTMDPSANLTLNISNLTERGYSLGTLMTAGQSFEFNNLFLRNGAFDASIAPVGLYGFNAIFIGGSSALDHSVVINVGLQLEIIHYVDAVNTMTVIPGSIQPGETATAMATLQNNMTDRNFVTSTWGIGDTGGMDYGWAGNWWNKTIAPGDSLTGPHSTWSVPVGSPLGTYYATNLVLGGLYNGDNYWFGANGNTVVNVVPEPLTMTTFGAGFLLLGLARRRKAKKS